MTPLLNYDFRNQQASSMSIYIFTNHPVEIVAWQIYMQPISLQKQMAYGCDKKIKRLCSERPKSKLQLTKPEKKTKKKQRTRTTSGAWWRDIKLYKNQNLICITIKKQTKTF